MRKLIGLEEKRCKFLLDERENITAIVYAPVYGDIYSIKIMKKGRKVAMRSGRAAHIDHILDNIHDYMY